jgi:hypothetical protein
LPTTTTKTKTKTTTTTQLKVEARWRGQTFFLLTLTEYQKMRRTINVCSNHRLCLRHRLFNVSMLNILCSLQTPFLITLLIGYII